MKLRENNLQQLENRGTKEEKNCSYNNGWQLVMDLGYIRYHFLAEHDYENNFRNFNPNDTLGNLSG